MDCEIYPKEGYTELHCFIDIEEYSKLLLSAKPEMKVDIVNDFSFLQELRGWLWEARGSNTADEYMNIVADVRNTFLKPLADKYGMRYVED